MEKELISLETFQKLDLRIARVEAAEKVEGSEKLLKLRLSLGDTSRQVISGIGKYYAPESLIGREVVLIANLEPKMLKGEESRGMILATGDDEIVLLAPDKPVPPGSEVR